MLIFDGLDFKTSIVKLRSRQTESCAMCRMISLSSCSQLPREVVAQKLTQFDYNQFCGMNNFTGMLPDVRLLEPSERVSCLEYEKINQDANKNHILIDTRPKSQFQICSLSNSISNFQNF